MIKEKNWIRAQQQEVDKDTLDYWATTPNMVKLVKACTSQNHHRWSRIL